ncbi:hypothetical protein BaRGS_00018390 [Batillaria attramentaria]|uniref:Uncharacterized protein n=1 Tax=Batillaria attramentaria TaxID=370345 RepID=A0ABD0KTJ9_9CAEN
MSWIATSTDRCAGSCVRNETGMQMAARASPAARDRVGSAHDQWRQLAAGYGHGCSVISSAEEGFGRELGDEAGARRREGARPNHNSIPTSRKLSQRAALNIRVTYGTDNPLGNTELVTFAERAEKGEGSDGDKWTRGRTGSRDPPDSNRTWAGLEGGVEIAAVEGDVVRDVHQVVSGQPEVATSRVKAKSPGATGGHLDL